MSPNSITRLRSLDEVTSDVNLPDSARKTWRSILSERGIAQKPSPLGAPNSTTFVATPNRIPFLERLALPVVDMPIAAVLLFPHNGKRTPQA